MLQEVNYYGYDTMIAKQVSNLQNFQKKEVLDFVNFLLYKKPVSGNTAKPKFNFEWEGALKKTYSNMSSVELQHNIWV